jgi:NAD-dependent deacetylase
MHGELLSQRCVRCGDTRRGTEAFGSDTPCPACSSDGNALRPDIVWFGEMPMHMDRIGTWLAECDLFVAIGTSGAVYPAAGFVREAGYYGAVTVEVNRDDSEVSSHFDHRILGLASEAVPRLVDALLEG